MARVSLITGGCRSGKSRHAQAMAEALHTDRIFIATCTVQDKEMEERVKRHQVERVGRNWTTIEAPTDLVESLAELENACVVIDCLTIWVSNLMFSSDEQDERFDEQQMSRLAAQLAEAASESPCDVILVTNEVGLGIVPDNELARRYRDLIGRCNQVIAAAADEVILMVSGIATSIKPSNTPTIESLDTSAHEMTEFASRDSTLQQLKGSTRRQRKTPSLMLQGISSSAGKSVLTTALCRILRQDGFRVAPFKSLNLSLNSFVTLGGGEMSRAQVVQAQACGLEPDVRMNPLLLKPNSESGSHVILDGQPAGYLPHNDNSAFKQDAWQRIEQAYDSLAEEFDVILIEGAGSPAEVNLKADDMANMAVARYADAPVLLVGDIDRGGVFASFVGTMQLLDPWERDQVAGYLVNRFRGEESLLDSAYDHLLEHTGKPVLGTVPFIEQIGIPDEDSVTFKEEVARQEADARDLEVVLIDLPHISNLSDFDALKAEADVSFRVARTPVAIGQPDVVILPGSRSTLHDLKALRERGFEPTLRRLVEQGQTEVIGICGGMQMLGKWISDPQQIESQSTGSEGFGWLDVTTELAEQKTLRQVKAHHQASGADVSGYEIRHGQTRIRDAETLLADSNEPLAIGSRDGRVWGTYLHGVFDNDQFRRWFLDQIRTRKGLPPLSEEGTVFNLDANYNRLADIVRQHVNLDAIYQLLDL